MCTKLVYKHASFRLVCCMYIYSPTPNPIGRRVSILPSDLDVSNQLINVVLELLEEIQEGEIQVNIPNFVS